MKDGTPSLAQTPSADLGTVGYPSRRSGSATVVLPFLMVAMTASWLSLILDERHTATNLWMLALLGLIVAHAHRFETAIALFAFAIPFEFIFYAWGDGRYNTLAYPAMLLAAIALTRRSLMLRLNAAEWAFVLLLAWAGLSVTWALDPGESVRAVFALTGSFAVMFAVRRGLRRPLAVRGLLGFFAVGVLIMYVVLAPYYERTTWIEAYGKTYLSTFGSADEVSHYEVGNAALVAFIGAFALATTKGVGRFGRWAYSSIAVVLATGALMSLSRSLALDLALCALTWVALAPRPRSWVRRLTLVAVIVGSAIGLAVLVNPGALEWRWDNTVVMAETGQLRSLSSGRTYIWSVGFEMFRENPVGGLGVGGFGVAFGEFIEGYERGSHSALVRFMVETGAVGVGLFVGMLLSLGRLAWRAGSWRHVAMMLWVYLVSEAVLNGYGRNKAVWLAAGLIAALADMAARARKETAVPQNTTPR